MHTGNRDLIKQINHSIALNLIKSRGPLSRTDIARLSGLSPSTVSGLADRLLASGFIQEVGAGASTGGRPRILLKLNPHAGFVVGLKLTERSIISALADLEANVLHDRLTPVQGMEDPQAAIAAISRAIEEVLNAADVPRARIMGIGIGLAGIIDSHTGVCTYSPILKWRQVELVRPLEERFRLPVYIDNDVNTLTIAEQWFGHGHGVEHFLVVTIGRGVGMGAVVNGQTYRGASGGAGEFGHITLQEDGPLCGCGKRGCLEALVADYALARMVREAVEAGKATALAHAVEGTEPLTIASVADAAQDGDAVALDIVARAGRALGLGLSYLVNLFNPQLIMLSGEGARAGEALIGPARETMRKHVFSGPQRDLLVVEPVGDEAWARGAACVVLSELFKHPLHKGEDDRELSLSTA
jgi:glucokinase-like ROK family protein